MLQAKKSIRNIKYTSSYNNLSWHAYFNLIFASVFWLTVNSNFVRWVVVSSWWALYFAIYWLAFNLQNLHCWILNSKKICGIPITLRDFDVNVCLTHYRPSATPDFNKSGAYGWAKRNCLLEANLLK